jgi:hypothetical protein
LHSELVIIGINYKKKGLALKSDREKQDEAMYVPSHHGKFGGKCCIGSDDL